MIAVAGILIGVALGLFLPFHIPSAYSSYVAIAIVASLDSVFGALSAWSRQRFDLKIFLSGFFGNAILAMILTYIGKRLDADLYLVALLVFGARMFSNFSTIRRYLLNRHAERKKRRRAPEEA